MDSLDELPKEKVKEINKKLKNKLIKKLRGETR